MYLKPVLKIFMSYTFFQLRARRKILGLAKMDVDDDDKSSLILDGRVALVVYSRALETFPGMLLV